MKIEIDCKIIPYFCFENSSDGKNNTSCVDNYSYLADKTLHILSPLPLPLPS